MTITRLVPLSPPWAIAVTNRGPAGVGATIAVDPDVIVLAPNEPGEVENIGNATHAIFKFSLPKGGTGDVGPAPSLDIGTVTTVPNGNAADAEITGGDGDYELNLTIPAGPTGPPPTLDIGDVESGVTADAEITGSDGEYELNLTLPIGPAPVMTGGTATPVPNGSPISITVNPTGPGTYEVDIEVPAGPTGLTGPMNPAVYDPNEVEDDAFDMDNMADGALQVAMTVGERAKLGVLPDIKRGTINTQAILQEMAWATGASRWKWVMESDASLALYFYNAAGTLIARYLWEQNGYMTIPLGLRMMDGGGQSLSTYIASTFSAGRTFAQRFPDSNIDLTYPASGRLATLERNQRAITGATDTLVLADIGKIIKGNSASTITITIPPVASVAFPVGTVLDLLNINTGVMALTPGSGVTLNSKNGNRKIASRYGAASLLHEASNSWVLFGDLSA